MKRTFAILLALLSHAALADRARAQDFATVQLVSAAEDALRPKVGEALSDGSVITADTRVTIDPNMLHTDAKVVDGTFSPIDAGGYFTVWAAKDGKVLWLVKVHNTLANDGANYLRDCFFKANSVALIANAPYVALLTATPTTSSTLGTMVEASTANAGYVRKLGTWTCTATGTCTNTAAPVSWTATSAGTGAIANVSYLAITDASAGTTGKLMSFAPLTGGPFTVNTNATLNVTYTWFVS